MVINRYDDIRNTPWDQDISIDDVKSDDIKTFIFNERTKFHGSQYIMAKEILEKEKIRDLGLKVYIKRVLMGKA